MRYCNPDELSRINDAVSPQYLDVFNSFDARMSMRPDKYVLDNEGPGEVLGCKIVRDSMRDNLQAYLLNGVVVSDDIPSALIILKRTGENAYLISCSNGSSIHNSDIRVAYLDAKKDVVNQAVDIVDTSYLHLRNIGKASMKPIHGIRKVAQDILVPAFGEDCIHSALGMAPVRQRNVQHGGIKERCFESPEYA